MPLSTDAEGIADIASALATAYVALVRALDHHSVLPRERVLTELRAEVERGSANHLLSGFVLDRIIHALEQEERHGP